MHHPTTPSAKRKIYSLLGAVLVVIAVLLLWPHHNAGAPETQSTNQHQSQTSTQQKPSQQAFDKSAYSLTDPSSIWVIVNKQHPLNPKTYVPTVVVPNVKLKSNASAENMHVSKTMAPHLEQLFAAAQAAGVPLKLSSGYRSYNYQVTVYNKEVSSYGQAKADSESARPGYSEHQTGLASDVAPADGTCDLSQCFGSTPAGQWLAAHAYEYGFIIRYPQGKESVTGYEYEPWHIRYVGIELSQELHTKGVQTLEEFFGVSGGPSYN
jgi:D-alanyl-D-alanine carboxypeptidase